MYVCLVGKMSPKVTLKKNPLSTVLCRRTLYRNIGQISHQQFSSAQKWGEKHVLFFMIHDLLEAGT